MVFRSRGRMTTARCPKNINDFSRSFQIIVLKTPRALVDVFCSTGVSSKSRVVIHENNKGSRWIGPMAMSDLHYDQNCLKNYYLYMDFHPKLFHYPISRIRFVVVFNLGLFKRSLVV